MMLNHILHNVVATQPDPRPAPGCPTMEPGQTGAGAAKAVCTVSGWGAAVDDLPSRLRHLVTDYWVRVAWWLLLAALLAVVLGAAWYTWRRWLWRRAVGRGTWLEVVAPRQTAVTASTAVWRLLSSLAVRAGSGAHLVHPPLSVEVHGDGRGRLALAIWVPNWIPASAITAEARRAWPGAAVRPFVPPTAADSKVAGFRMTVHTTDHELLVDDVYLRSRLAASVSPQGDPLRPVFDALREAGGPTVLQILAKPAKGTRLGRLAQAARQPAKPRRPLPLLPLELVSAAVIGVSRGLLDLITPGRSTSRQSGHANQYRPPDPLQRLAMRRAAEKLKGGPHLLVAIRAVAVRPTKGWAVADASALANGYRVAASGLRPKRLWWARSAVSDRYAHRGEWLLATCSELGVLLHFPADPALFGFPMAALSRPFPHLAARLRPEQAFGSEPGWSRGRWEVLPGTTLTALAVHDNNNGHHNGSHDGSHNTDEGYDALSNSGFDAYGGNPHSEYQQYIDDDLEDDLDSDGDFH